MFHRLLFAVRRLGLDAGRFLGSWRLSIVLMVVLALYQALLAIWARSSPAVTVAAIARLVPFVLVYLLLLANTTVCLVRRLPRLRREPRAVLGTWLFHGAFLLLAAGFFLTFVARHEVRIQVAEGERFDGRADQILGQSPPRILSPGPPRMAFTVAGIVPELWRDQLLFTRLEAELELDGARRATTRINRPLWWDPITFLRLSGFGYAPRYELVDRDGRVLDTAVVKLDVFPPGQRDHFRIPGYPHRFYVEVLPDAAVEDGRSVTRSLELVNPAVILQVWRGRLAVGEAVLGAGERLEFEGIGIGFPEIRYWGELTVVRDPGAPLVFAGYAVGLLGLVLGLLLGPGSRQQQRSEEEAA